HVVVDYAAVVGETSLQRIPASSDQGPCFLFTAENCRLKCTLLDPILYADAHAREYRLFQFFYPLREFFLLLFVLCGVAGAIVFCFLMVAAGRRRGQEGISLNHQDKIPLDLYLLAAGFLELLAATAAYELFYALQRSWPDDGSSFMLLLLCLLLSAMILLALSFCMSLATRLKLGRWWRNTAVFFLLWLVGRFFRGCRWLLLSITEALPMSWALVLGGIGLFLLESLLLAASVVIYRYRGFLLVFLLFNLLLLLGLCFLGRNLQRLRKAGQHLAAGEFDYQVDTRHMLPPLAQHGRELNAIGQGMAIAVEQRTKSERLKTELITNVSHDIKTPLTSIINYVDLLQKAHSPEEEKEYLAVLARQSQRLKKLTEDLVEASKASTGNIQAELLPTNVNEILQQAAAEYGERFREGKLELQMHLPETPLEILADGRLLWRMVDNLLNNVVKYTLPGTRVYIDAFSQGKMACISVKNVSREALNISADELMERFVRGDSSRNTEGSGLGLNIAKSLAELQGGELSLRIDGDLFKALLCFPLLPE
ncbi:MAG: HAMP domain-containing sensor histidine kinase, partial [Bacillota bacterium]|nr:HAMP domain-containing sensor histidine kinase [Bacillota bacterium]